MARGPARKKGASRNTGPKGRRSGVPGWTWLLLGLAIGVFTAFLWHLWELRKDSGKPAVAAIGRPAAAPATDTPAKKEAPEETRFEFYTLLPSQEVMPGKNPAPSKPASKTGAEPAYVLQAGSFKSEAEADRRRAAILMLGLPVKIIRVPVKPGETWYRVVVGPFPGKAAAQSARGNLRSNGVDTLVLKQG